MISDHSLYYEDLPLSQQFFHNLSTKKKVERQLLRSKRNIRCKIRTTLDGLQKGSILGITCRIPLSQARELKRDNTIVQESDKFIAERVLMLHRHTMARMRILEVEVNSCD